MSDFPPRDRLLQVARSLVRHLPEALEGLLEAPRFAAGAGALERLADPGRLEAAVAALSVDEAAWLAEVLLERWARVGEVRLEPAVAVIAPEVVTVTDQPVKVTVTLATSGIDLDWEAVWEGDVVPGPPGQSAVLVVRPPEDDGPAVARVRARVRARANGQRCLLLAEGRVGVCVE